MPKNLPQLFIPFVQEPRFATYALKRGIVQNRGRCVPTLKKSVQGAKSALTKFGRVAFHRTTTSNYVDIVNKHLHAVPIGYVSHILPAGRGPTGNYFPKKPFYGEWHSLFESIIFRCGYNENSIVDKIARSGRVGRKIAEAMQDAKYYWSTIGAPIAKKWVQFGFAAASAGVSGGQTTKRAFGGNASLGTAKKSALRMRDVRSGKYTRDIIEQCRQNFSQFQSFYSNTEAYKVVFSPNEAYLSPYNRGGKEPVVPTHVPYMYDKKLPGILIRNGLGLVHNFMNHDHYYGDEVINAFNTSCPCVVGVTQFTPLLNLNDEIVLAHDKRVIRVREIGEHGFQALLENLAGDYNPSSIPRSGIEAYFKQFCYPDMTVTPKSSYFDTYREDIKMSGVWSYKRELGKGPPAYFLRNLDQLDPLPGWHDLSEDQRRLRRRHNIPTNILHPLTEKGIKHWTMEIEFIRSVDQVYRTNRLRTQFFLDEMHPWIIRC